MITVNDASAKIVIGRAGENIYRRVEIDVSDWMRQYQGGTVTAAFQRPDGVTYQVPVALSEMVAVWEPTETDTLSGCGFFELRLRVSDMLGKSALFQTICQKSLMFPENADPPTDLPPGAEPGQVLTWTPDGAKWKESVTTDKVVAAVDEYLKENPDKIGVNFTTDETLTLDPETKVLSVNTAKAAEKDNTLPITSAAVHTEIGNIEVLLAAL